MEALVEQHGVERPPQLVDLQKLAPSGVDRQAELGPSLQDQVDEVRIDVNGRPGVVTTLAKATVVLPQPTPNSSTDAPAGSPIMRWSEPNAMSW